MLNQKPMPDMATLVMVMVFPDTAMPISDMDIPTITMARDQLNPNLMDITDTMDIPITMVILITTTLLSKLLMVLLEFIPVVLLHPFPEVLKVWENKSSFLSNCSSKIIKKTSTFTL